VRVAQRHLPPPHKRQRTTQSGDVGDKVPAGQEGIALPNPHFFRIHSAIAGILHYSGAGEEIDAAINRAGWRHGAVRVGDDLDHLFLRESLSALFMNEDCDISDIDAHSVYD